MSDSTGGLDRPDSFGGDGAPSPIAVLTALPEGLIVTDLDGVVRFANAAAASLLGREPEQLVGQPAGAVLSPLSANGGPIRWDASALGRALKGEQVDAVGVHLAGPNGPVAALVGAAPVNDGLGRSCGAVVVLRRDQAPPAAEDGALSQAQKMEAIGRLTGGVAHDFNNLLTVIQSSVDLLQRTGLSDARRARYVKAIGEAADRAAALTGQLLAFARRQPLQPGAFDAHAVLQRLSQILRAMAGPGVRFALEADRTPCWVVASVGLFEIAIINLAVNARDAMDGEGEIRISLRHLDEAPGPAGAAASGPFVAVTVADTGAGMAATELERIFEPFYTTKPVGRGTGLGLSQVQTFARQSGGEVRVESRPGEGARFTLFLPRGEAVEPPRTLPPDAHNQDGAVLRVLMVEDDERVAELSAQLLASLGFSTTVVGSAEAALEALTLGRGDFDLLLTDVVMPGPIDGLQLARTVKSRWSDLPVVLTTGASDILARAEGDFAVLPKPFSAELLRRVLRQAASS